MAVLRAANGQFLDCEEILERVVPAKQSRWEWWRNGHKIGPSLAKLAEQGLVVHGERRGSRWTWGLATRGA
jgi:hypothetical protein